MNRHKILLWIRILLCIVSLFVPSWGLVRYNETKFQIFDNRSVEFEAQLFQSLQTTKNVFARQDVEKVGLVVSVYASVLLYTVPYVREVMRLTFVAKDLFAHESDWKKGFARTVAFETELKISESDIGWIEATMTTMEDKFQILIDNKTNLADRRTVAAIIHGDMDKILNFFVRSAFFKKYPLSVGTPPLIALAQLIAVFDPLAKALIPQIAVIPDLSCKMHNILLDYRPRVVNARLEKLYVQRAMHSEHLIRISRRIFDAMSEPYNQYGYNNTINATMDDCEKGCVRSKPAPAGPISFLFIRRGRESSIFKTSGNSPMCLYDDLGADTYFFRYIETCMIDYALLIRHRVEQLFPVELLNKLCVKPQQLTGFGWLTMKLKSVRARRKWDSTCCDHLGNYDVCDSFVELSIDGKSQFRTSTREDTCCYDDLNYYYTSKRIPKSAIIKIEVWDEDSTIFKNLRPDLILRTEGSVDSFLNQGYRAINHGGGTRHIPNSIDTISFWQDEYKNHARNDE